MPRKAEYTDRPLTAEEREFAAEHHGLIYRYMKNMKLDPEESKDIFQIRNYMYMGLCLSYLGGWMRHVRRILRR